MASPMKVGGLIRVIRGRRVMLDGDLARLYGVEVGALNRAVKRNRVRFPPDFMFQLNRVEAQASRCQSGILNRGQNIKYLPYAFTEQGVAMLSSVLRSRRAAEVNVAIMRAFIRLREAVAARSELARRLAEIEKTLTDHGAALGRHAGLIQEGLDAIAELMKAPEEPRRRIGFEGGRG
ncbi:MAG: ORF6N domain-containing protein [Elusimicrobia bacterium]|nr:ORF6N domain-containing protein [Elusimicrobiota bacterium]